MGVLHKQLLQATQEPSEALQKLPGILGKTLSENRGVDGTGMLVVTESLLSKICCSFPAMPPSPTKEEKAKEETLLFLRDCAYNT